MSRRCGGDNSSNSCKEDLVGHSIAASGMSPPGCARARPSESRAATDFNVRRKAHAPCRRPIAPRHPFHLPRGPVNIMIARSAIQRQAQRALAQSWQQPARGYAAASAGGSLQYQQGDSSGLKYASRDNSGAVSTVALVSKAGTRYQNRPGLTEALQRYAFRVRRAVSADGDI